MKASWVKFLTLTAAIALGSWISTAIVPMIMAKIMPTSTAKVGG